MAKDQTSIAVVPDLATLRAALDAPARERAAAEAREREAEQRQRQTALLAYARQIVKDLTPAGAASAAWAATPVDVVALRKTFGEMVPMWQAFDAVNSGSRPIEDAARVAGEVARLVKELERPGVLPAARLTAILTALDGAAGHVEGFVGVYAGWVRVRQDGVALLPAIRDLLNALERRWATSPEENLLLAQAQQRLADAARAMPPIPPAAPRRRVGGADFDAVRPATSVRRPLLENDLG